MEKKRKIMEVNNLYCRSSEQMSEIKDESVTLVVTSPPYNIGVRYGNKHQNGRAVASKGVKYDDDLSDQEYADLLRKTFTECKRVLKKNGSIWVNIKNKYQDGVITPPFWLLDL